jgi:pimeloyl-ACP methyl ester carboxylesterase
MVRAAVLVAAAVVASTCSAKEQIRSEALAASSPVTFESSDGVKLSGRIFGSEGAAAGVVLAHMLPADQVPWFDTAAELGARGYRALTFNFRGYCPGGDAGCSEGDKQIEGAQADLEGAVAFLRSQGVTRLALVGASMGGTAALRVAAAEGTEVEAVITLSAPQSIDGLSAGPDVMAGVSAAKLFIAGTGDPTAAQAAEAFYNASIQPKRYEIVTSDDHGTDLLDGNQGARVRELIYAWLGQYLTT